MELPNGIMRGLQLGPGMLKEKVNLGLQLKWVEFRRLNSEEEAKYSSCLSSGGCNVIATLFFIAKFIIKLVIKNLF